MDRLADAAEANAYRQRRLRTLGCRARRTSTSPNVLGRDIDRRHGEEPGPRCGIARRAAGRTVGAERVDSRNSGGQAALYQLSNLYLRPKQPQSDAPTRAFPRTSFGGSAGSHAGDGEGAHSA